MIKKITTGIFGISLIMATLYSCNKAELTPSKTNFDTNKVNVSAKSKENVDFRFTDYNELNNQKSTFNGLTIVETRVLNGTYQGSPFSIIASRLENNDFAYDIDKDGVLDYQLHQVGTDYNKVQIIDNNLKVIGKSELKNVNQNVLVTYSNYSEGLKLQSGAKPTPRSCFESTAGSMEGILGAAAAGFCGPWAVAAYYGGIYARCASKY